MSRIRGKDTSLEIKVRKYIFSKGYRYMINYDLQGKPDIAFPKKKVAVFINGCFWHMHSCGLSSIPTARREFWEKKLNRNKERDKEVSAILEKQGWKVFRLWECEIKQDLEKAILPLLNYLVNK